MYNRIGQNTVITVVSVSSSFTISAFCTSRKIAYQILAQGREEADKRFFQMWEERAMTELSPIKRINDIFKKEFPIHLYSLCYSVPNETGIKERIKETHYAFSILEKFDPVVALIFPHFIGLEYPDALSSQP